jgi:hypothetical protein
MGNCECALSRPLRPVCYASVTKEFVTNCAANGALFGRSFGELRGDVVQELELVWALGEGRQEREGERTSHDQGGGEDQASGDGCDSSAKESIAGFVTALRDDRATAHAAGASGEGGPGDRQALSVPPPLAPPLPPLSPGPRDREAWAGGDAPFGDGEGRYVLSRHDVGRTVEIFQHWRTARGAGDVRADGGTSVLVRVMRLMV